jgi:hypothetical protein
VEKETLSQTMGEYGHDLMRMYYEFGDIDTAIMYAGQALEIVAQFDDPERSLGGPFGRT